MDDFRFKPDSSIAQPEVAGRSCLTNTDAEPNNNFHAAMNHAKGLSFHGQSANLWKWSFAVKSRCNGVTEM
jgi:hypothetical protein